jgi:L-ascorbate metabolism protein UlaG (beta-lactamase superfamily)
MGICGKKKVMSAKRHRPIAHLAATVKIARSVAPGYWKEYRKQRRQPLLPAPFKPHPRAWPDTGLYAAWLGHSTVLVKVDGFTFITDPVLGSRCGVNMGPMTVGLKRLVAPALSRRDLPLIDMILLSHAHFDHFDRATLRALQSAGTSVVTAHRTSDLLRVRRFQGVHELRWDDSINVGPLRIRAFEVNHWGARIRTDAYRGYNGYIIDTGRRQIVFGGDTAMTESFRRVRNSRPVDLAIMPIGAYDPCIHVHCNPEQALRMAHDVKAEHILPVHHQTFRLSREPYLEPIHRTLEAAGRDQWRVAVQRIGQEWRLG